jgi:AcrR family transcriptional regulator
MNLALTHSTIQSLAEVGYQRTTTSEICRRAGVSSGAIQHHYGSKDELIYTVFMKINDEFRKLFEQTCAIDGSVPDRCEDIVFELWEAHFAHAQCIASWEIIVGTRGDQALFHRIVRYREQNVAACHLIWAKAFNLSKADTEKREALNLVISFLRGVALNFFNRSTEDAIESQLLTISSTLEQIMCD